jgi:hypothetical protein
MHMSYLPHHYAPWWRFRLELHAAQQRSRAQGYSCTGDIPTAITSRLHALFNSKIDYQLGKAE